MAKEIVHTGYMIESLSVLFDALNEKAKELSPKKTLSIRNLFAVAHISGTDKKIVKNLSETLPLETTGQVVSYCAIKKFESQGAFIGICIKCVDKTFYTVLYDNGKNNLYKCVTYMKQNLGKFIKLEPPLEVKLRKYIMYKD
jgi:hypothetical protein